MWSGSGGSSTGGTGVVLKRHPRRTRGIEDALGSTGTSPRLVVVGRRTPRGHVHTTSQVP